MPVMAAASTYFMSQITLPETEICEKRSMNVTNFHFFFSITQIITSPPHLERLRRGGVLLLLFSIGAGKKKEKKDSRSK